MIRFGRPRSFDLALAHGSNDLAIAVARCSASPRRTCTTTSTRSLQHRVGCRLATPRDLPRARSRPSGCAGSASAREKLCQYPGPQGGVLPRRLRARPRRVPERARRSTPRGWWSSSARRPTSPLYHRKSNPLFPEVLMRLGRRRRRPRRRAAADRRRSASFVARASSCPRVIVPERAVEAQSLIALADLVVSAGRDDEPRGGRARDARSTRPTAVASEASTRR